MTSTAPGTRYSLTHSRMTVYADFTSADCYLASVRTDHLVDARLPAPDWRPIEHRPRLPLAGIRLGGSAQSIRGRALTSTRHLLQPGEEFEARIPGFLPNTRAAIAAYAEAYEVGIANLARRLLFDAYWVQGADIGDPEVLRRLLGSEVEHARASTHPPLLSGYVVTSQRGPVSTAAHLRVRAWEQDWLALGAPVDLTVVSPHAVACGRPALQVLTPTPALAA